MANPNSADIIAKNLADKICAQIKEKNCLFEDPTVEGVTEPVQPTKSIDGREYTNQTNMLITLLNSMFQPEYGYKYATKYKIKSLGGNLRKGQSIKPIIIEKNFMMYAEKPKEKQFPHGKLTVAKFEAKNYPANFSTEILAVAP